MDFTGRDPLRGCKHLTDGGSGGRGCFFFFACARISSITPLHTKTGLKIEKEGQVRMDTSPARRPPKYNCPTVRSGPVGPSLGILMNIFWARFCVFLATRWGDDWWTDFSMATRWGDDWWTDFSMATNSMTSGEDSNIYINCKNHRYLFGKSYVRVLGLADWGFWCGDRDERSSREGEPMMIVTC